MRELVDSAVAMAGWRQRSLGPGHRLAVIAGSLRAGEAFTGPAVAWSGSGRRGAARTWCFVAAMIDWF
ncbi:MAG: hypothetical protein ACPGXI_04545 [Mycobacterium sp.]